MKITLPLPPNPMGAVTTHTNIAQQFTPWPHPPYLDTATDCTSVYSIQQLRARDLEVARVVLEAAAKVLDDLQAKDHLSNYFKYAANNIRALEVES